MPDIIANIVKKSVNVATSNPQNDLAGSPSIGNNVARLPARMLLAALLINQTPISRLANRTGDSLFTIDRPIGESDSSPMV